MPKAQTMTDEEKVDISYQACMLRRAGDEEGYMRLTKTIPMPPYLAKIMKEKVGSEYLINSGWNLSEAEAAFGPDWLSR